MTAPMVAAFKRIFTMSTFQASLVQFAYYWAYFALAFGRRSSISGSLQDWSTDRTRPHIARELVVLPVQQALTHPTFLVALFTLAAGFSMLDMSQIVRWVGLVMAIVGGVLMPLVQARLSTRRAQHFASSVDAHHE
jgi:fucose permease